MTDTTRDSALDTESVVPVTIGAAGDPEGATECSGEGREGPIARQRRLG